MLKKIHIDVENLSIKGLYWQNFPSKSLSYCHATQTFLKAKIKALTKLADTHTCTWYTLHTIWFPGKRIETLNMTFPSLSFELRKFLLQQWWYVVVVLYPYYYTVAISEQNHCVKFFAIKPRVEIEEARIPTSTSTTSFISFPNFCSLFPCSQKGMNVWYFFKPMFVFQLVQLAVVGLDRSIPIAVGQAFWESFRWQAKAQNCLPCKRAWSTSSKGWSSPPKRLSKKEVRLRNTPIFFHVSKSDKL